MRLKFIFRQYQIFPLPKLNNLCSLLICISSITTRFGQSENKLGSWFIYYEFFNDSAKVEYFLKPTNFTFTKDIFRRT